MKPSKSPAASPAQVQLAAERLAVLRAASDPVAVRGGPAFAGSRDVGGADADLIVGDLLLEVKASAKPTLKPQDFYQLIGYVLLDYNDEYHIERVGLYLTRFGHLVTWTVPECLALLGAEHDLAELRSLFSDAVKH